MSVVDTQHTATTRASESLAGFDDMFGSSRLSQVAGLRECAGEAVRCFAVRPLTESDLVGVFGERGPDGGFGWSGTEDELRAKLEPMGWPVGASE